MHETRATDARSRYRVRLATKADVDWIVTMRLAMEAHMLQRSPRLWPTSARAKNTLAVIYHSRLGNPDNCMLVVESADNEALIGMGMGRVDSRLDVAVERVGKITEVMVDPTHRRQGVCTAIVTELVHFFRKRDASAVTLSYSVGNIEAEETWGRFGFEPTIIKATATLEEIEEQLGSEDSARHR